MGEHGEHWSLVGRWLCLAGLVLLAPAAQAQCRLALLLALDVSASVDGAEYDLQRDGVARALNAPDIRGAILDDPSGDVALAVYEWSGPRQQTVMLDWMLLDSPARLDQAIAAIHEAKRGWKDFPTSVGYALGYGAGLLERAPPCDRKVIDVSGDGPNNEGFLPEHAYRHFPFAGVTVNGLVITGQQDGAEAFYRSQVLRGPGAFLEIATGFEDFERAMGNKLFREINGLILGQQDRDGHAPG